MKKINFDSILYCALFGNALFFLWSNRYLPLQDYPDWVYQGYLFKQFLSGNLSGHYHLLTYPVPYSLVTVLMGLLGLVFQPEIAGKIFLTLTLTLFILGSFYWLTYFRTSLGKALLFVPFLFLVNYFFLRGTLSYVFGLGILFFCVGYLLRTFLDHRPWNPWFIFASSVVLFFAHGLVYSAWMLFTFVLMIFLRRNGQAIRNIVFGSIPSLVLCVAYVLLKDPAAKMDLAPPTGLKPLVLHKLGAISALLPLHDFYPFLNSNPDLTLPLLFNVSFFLFLLGLGVLWLFKIRESVSSLASRYLAVMAFLFAGVTLLVPPTALSADGIDLRFVYPLLFCLIASLSQVSSIRWGRHLIRWVLIAAALTQAVYLHLHVSQISRNMEDIMSTIRPHVIHSDFLFVDEAYFKFDTGFTREVGTNGLIENFFIPRHHHLSTLTSLLSAELGRETPIFTVGLFTYQGPKRWIRSVQDIEGLEHPPEKFIILGGNGGNREIARALSSHYTVALEKDSLILMKMKNERYP